MVMLDERRLIVEAGSFAEPMTSKSRYREFSFRSKAIFGQRPALLKQFFRKTELFAELSLHILLTDQQHSLFPGGAWMK